MSALAHVKSVPGGLNVPDEVLQKICCINPTRLMPKVKARLQQLDPVLVFPERSK